MRLSILAAVATFSAGALAQGNLIGSIPECAQKCFGTDSLGSCSILDVACICKSSAITKVACCVLSSCDQSDINSTISFASTLCSGAGVTLDTSPDCGAVSSGVSASSSASASASASSASAASASSSASVTAISGTNTPSGSATRSAASGSASGSVAPATATGAGALQSAGPALGLGVAFVGMLAAL